MDKFNIAFVVAFVVCGSLTFAWVRVRYWKAAFREATMQTVGILDRRSTSLQSELDKLTAVHPDWQAVVASPAFAAWVQSAGRPALVVVSENANEIIDGAACAAVLTEFKQRRRIGK